MWNREILEDHLYKGINREPVFLELPKTLPWPWQKFSYFVEVRHSDTDNLHHFNQASYFQLCMDAAAEGAKLGHFWLLKHDLLSYPIESMECLLQGESGPGDQLVVHVWENDKIPYQLFFHTEKEYNVIWKGSFIFSPMVDAKL